MRLSRRLRYVAGLACAGALMVTGASAAPRTTELVFDGHHGAPLGDSYRHEGTFTATAPFCSSGAMADIAHFGENADRLVTCDDGSGTITMRVTNLPGEHFTNGTGDWRITAGTGGYVTLRGHGTWTTVPVGGPDARFISTLRGIADLDDQAPTITVTRATAAKLPRPKGAYRIRLVVAARDNVEGNAVSYRVALSAGARTWTRAGRTTSGSIKLSLQVRPPHGARRIRLKITASDPLDNEKMISRWIKLRPTRG